MKLWKRCSVACVAVLLCVCTAFALVACHKHVGVYRYRASIADHYGGVLSDDIIERFGDCSVGAYIELVENGTWNFASSLYTPNGKSNADLHRPTGAHRIKRTKQRLPHWYHADQIVKNRAQLLFCTHRI